MISEKKLRQFLQEAIKNSGLNEVVKPSVFESECTLIVNIAENVTDILTKIRAIESVTIVNIIPGGGKKIGRDVEKLQIKIKFVKGGFSIRQRLSVIINKIGKIAGVVGFNIIRTRKLEKY
jgi:hypothetical protein